MIYRKLGNTGIDVSALGFGSMRLPMTRIGSEEYVDIDRGVDAIRRAFELGVNYIDSGFVYCANESEITVGKALRGWRDKITVSTKATKMRMESPGDLRRMLEHQLIRMDIDYFDFYCFHGIGWDNFHEIDRKTGWIENMMKAKEEGLFKRVGFSFHDEPENMKKLIDLGYFDMVTCQYNYLDQKNADSIRYANEKGLGVVVMGPVGGGRLAGLPGFLKDRDNIDTSSAARLALRFVLSNPNVHVALSGMGSVQEVEENVEAADAGPLSGDEETALNDLIDKTGKLADLYCTGCKYCMPCEHGVDIPARFEAMNCLEVFGLKDEARKRYANIRKQELNTENGGKCIECGKCETQCPQNIPIIKQLEETEKALAG